MNYAINIFHLRNPDCLLYNTMDDDFAEGFRLYGATVHFFILTDLYVIFESDKLTLYNKHEPVDLSQFQGFFYYGECSPTNMENIKYILEVIELSGVIPIHPISVVNLLRNKLQ